MEEKKVRFIKKIKRTESVYSFRFTSEMSLDFVAGQYLQIIFDEENRTNRDLNKFLSFSCAPGKDYFEVTKRLSDSGFSKRLSSLQEGESVLCKMPIGKCTIEEGREKVLFLVGGIGITPVISILEDIVVNEKKVDVCLLYSNRTQDDIAFKHELDSWNEKRNDFHIVYALSDCEPKDFKCEVGFINKEMLLRNVCDWEQRIIYVFGPPAMVAAMRALCREVNCCPQQLRFETFIGY